MAKTYIKELQEKIEALEDGFDLRELEIQQLINARVDDMEPAVISDKITLLCLEMLIEYTEFVMKKGKETEANLKSKKRLVDMLGLVSRLSGLTSNLNTLKLINRGQVTKINLLRVENAELKQQVDNMKKAYEEL